MIRLVPSLAMLLITTAPASAFDSIDLSYQPLGGPCDGQYHEVTWTNPGPTARTVRKTIITGVGTPQLGGQPVVASGAWYSEIRIEGADGLYKTIAVAMDEYGKGSGATNNDYPDGLIIVQPGESLVHRTVCVATGFYYAWAWALLQ